MAKLRPGVTRKHVFPFFGANGKTSVAANLSNSCSSLGHGAAPADPRNVVCVSIGSEGKKKQACALFKQSSLRTEKEHILFH